MFLTPVPIYRQGDMTEPTCMCLQSSKSRCMHIMQHMGFQ